ncbi:carboxypeptidase 2 [Fusarium subglutinans]|uniref:Carboxypeptidase M14B n=1 Tax=Gibberella subglutinans TaxID=42677 RepID=A0A8H5LFK3_GIBSU|nr:carboxypeptidase 2 [Fusarium subglutinans]KAF5591004.1 carboxypeptidase 2 [Fusarium subglutinans]
MAQRIVAFAALVSVVAGQSGGIQKGLQYGENWAPTTKDSDLVSANFPDVNITLRSPAFLSPEKIPARFSNGTEGPTNDIELDYFIRNLAQKHDWMSYESAAFQSEEGRAIQYVFLSLPNTNSSSGKLRIYLQAAIHGNEPAADESVLAFLGKMDAEPEWAKSILEKMDIKILPRYNVDGVAYFQRQLASNLDPNREHLKLMRRQSRDIKRVVSEWNPHIALDMHEFTVPTIYGGHYQHGADSLLSGGINPNIHPKIREQLLDFFIPAVGGKLESQGLRWEPYVTGPSSRTEGSRIRFTEAVTEARTGRNAVGLTQTISFLLEMRGIRIANQHFQRRVATALIKIQTILELARDDADKVRSVVENAREDFINSDEDIVITDSYVPENRTFTMVDTRNGSVVQVPIDFQRTTPSIANLTRPRPEAYVIPRTWSDVAERLEILGLKVERMNYEFRRTLETLRIETSVVEPELYEGTYLNTVTTNSTRREVVLPAGSYYVSTRQQNAALAFIALEPENIDSYVKFNIIPVEAGMEYPVFRVPRDHFIHKWWLLQRADLEPHIATISLHVTSHLGYSTEQPHQTRSPQMLRDGEVCIVICDPGLRNVVTRNEAAGGGHIFPVGQQPAEVACVDFFASDIGVTVRQGPSEDQYRRRSVLLSRELFLATRPDLRNTGHCLLVPPEDCCQPLPEASRSATKNYCSVTESDAMDL